jgi:hypothetical protein
MDPSSVTLAPGQSTDVEISLATIVTPGTYAGQATLSNSDADEGTFALNLTGIVTGPSPLAISNVTGKFPSTVVAGTRAARGTVTFTLSNVSSDTLEAGRFVFIASASSDQVEGPNDLLLLETQKQVKLKPGASKKIKLKVSFPADAPTGQQFVVVSGGVNGVTATGATPTAVTVQAPFVRITGSNVPAPVTKPLTFGKPAKLSVRLTNEGNVPTTKTPATYSLIVSNNGTPAGQVFSTTALGRINLKPGATKPQKLSVTFPPGSFAAGSYTLIVRVNAELNDANGQTVALLPFTIA